MTRSTVTGRPHVRHRDVVAAWAVDGTTTLVGSWLLLALLTLFGVPPAVAGPPSSRVERLRQAWIRPNRRRSGSVRPSRSSQKLALVSAPLAPAWVPRHRPNISPGEPGRRPEKARRSESVRPLRVRRYRKPMVAHSQCLALLKKLEVPFRPARPHFGIHTPVRLTGPVGGVVFRSKWRPKEQPLMDCLLAVTLARAAPVFRAHGIREVRFSSTYRRGRRGDPRPSRHALGLAMDVRDLVFSDGTVLNVAKDWEKFYGRPGDCVGRVSKRAARLRSLVCDLERARIYRRILSPDSNPGHWDHLHMSSAKAGEQWVRDRWAGRLLYQPLPGSKFFPSWNHWYVCYKKLRARARAACYRRRRPGWVVSGSPYRFRARRTPPYLAEILAHLPHGRTAHETHGPIAHKTHGRTAHKTRGPIAHETHGPIAHHEELARKRP